MEDEHEGRWLTYAEVGEDLGVSADAARKRIARNPEQWEKRTLVDGTVMVRLKQPPETPGQRTDRTDRPDVPVLRPITPVTLDADLSGLSNAIREALESSVSAVNEANRELIEELRQRAIRAETRVTELEAERARPWWRRLWRGDAPPPA